MIINRVRARRLELGMTLGQLSKESGVPISTIAAIESGTEPKVTTAQRLAWALYTPIDELWPRNPKLF